MKTFDLEANATATFFLNGRLVLDSGGGNPKNVDTANIQCTIVR